MMFGIGTRKARLHVNSFTNLLGEDENGWGLSHKGEFVALVCTFVQWPMVISRTHLARRSREAVLQSIQGEWGDKDWDFVRRNRWNVDILQGRCLSWRSVPWSQRGLIESLDGYHWITIFVLISDSRAALPDCLFNSRQDRDGFVQHEARLCEPSRSMPCGHHEARENPRSPWDTQTTVQNYQLFGRVAVRDARCDLE